MGGSGGVLDAGPDKRHPFVIRGLRVWESHWAVAPTAPGVLIDGLEIFRCDFGLWRPHYDRHAYRNVNVLPDELGVLFGNGGSAGPGEVSGAAGASG